MHTFTDHHLRISSEALVLTHPTRTQEDIKDLLLCDWLVGGLWVSLGCWSEDRVDVGIN